MRVFVLALTCVAVAAESPDSDLDRWRTWYTEGLRTDGSVLSYTGLFWLKPGENLIGSDRACQIKLPRGRSPRRLAAIDLKDGRLFLRVFKPHTVSLNGKPYFRTAELITDATGTPDVIGWAPDLNLFAVNRGGRLGIVLADRQAPARRTFAGNQWHPADPAWRIPARYIPGDSPRTIGLQSKSGTVRQMASPGVAEFIVNGKTYRLAPVQVRNSLYFYFRDTAEESGPIRVLRTDYPHGDLILDFNRAYRPACVYSEYADCEVPPAENVLDLRIPAGEKSPVAPARAGLAR